MIFTTIIFALCGTEAIFYRIVSNPLNHGHDINQLSSSIQTCAQISYSIFGLNAFFGYFCIMLVYFFRLIVIFEHSSMFEIDKKHQRIIKFSSIIYFLLTICGLVERPLIGTRTSGRIAAALIYIFQIIYLCYLLKQQINLLIGFIQRFNIKNSKIDINDKYSHYNSNNSNINTSNLQSGIRSELEHPHNNISAIPNSNSKGNISGNLTSDLMVDTTSNNANNRINTNSAGTADTTPNSTTPNNTTPNNTSSESRKASVKKLQFQIKYTYNGSRSNRQEHEFALKLHSLMERLSFLVYLSLFAACAVLVTLIVTEVVMKKETLLSNCIGIFILIIETNVNILPIVLQFDFANKQYYIVRNIVLKCLYWLKCPLRGLKQLIYNFTSVCSGSDKHLSSVVAEESSRRTVSSVSVNPGSQTTNGW